MTLVRVGAELEGFNWPIHAEWGGAGKGQVPGGYSGDF